MNDETTRLLRRREAFGHTTTHGHYMNNSSPPIQMQPHPGSAASNANVISISALLDTIWRGKWFVIACTFVCMCVGGYYAFIVATPKFRATTVLMLSQRQDNVIDLETVVSNLGTDSITLNTEIQVLQSRNIMGQVVEELNLIEDPEFNSRLQTPSAWSQLRTRVRSLLGFLFPTEAPVVASPERREQRMMDRTISRLIQAVTIENEPRTSIFRLTAETEGATKSARVVDTLAQIYVDRQLAQKFEATEQASIWLSGRVADLQVELEQAEIALQNFSAESDLVSTEVLAAMGRQHKEMRDRIAAAENTLSQLTAQLAALRKAETREAQAEATGNTQLTALLPRLDDPAAVASFDQITSRIESQLASEVQRTTRQLETMGKASSDLEAQIEAQNNDLITLQQLTREVEATRALYESFLTRLKETSVQQGIQQADSSVLSNAVVPGTASSPRKMLILVMTSLVGLFIGALLVLLREARKSTFRSPTELERETGYLVMGQIPLLPTRRRKDVITYLKERPSSAAAEAIRNMRTSLMLSDIDTPPQVIATTSATPAEGKTTLALSLAQNFSGMGRKVLLIEGDIRRRVLTQYLDATEQSGLLALLNGDKALDECLLYSDDIGGDVLMAEQSSAVNAADLFSSISFKNLVQELRQRYDTIIIDTPPVLVVPDARIIAQHVDAMLFVVAWDQTSKGQVEAGLQMFSTSSDGTVVKGLALNKINPRGMRSYGYGDRYGAYSTYGRRYYVD